MVISLGFFFFCCCWWCCSSTTNMDANTQKPQTNSKRFDVNTNENIKIRNCWVWEHKYITSRRSKKKTNEATTKMSERTPLFWIGNLWILSIIFFFFTFSRISIHATERERKKMISSKMKRVWMIGARFQKKNQPKWYSLSF